MHDFFGADSEPVVKQNRLDITVQYREILVLKVHRYEFGHSLCQTMYLEFLSLNMLEFYLFFNTMSNFLPLFRTTDVI